MKSIKLQAVINSIRAKVDRSISLSISTPELNPEEVALFFQLQGINVGLTIIPSDEKKPEEYKVNKDLDTKSQSQRIRSVLYILFEQDSEGMNFEDYYKDKTEKYINHLKEKIIQ